MQPLDIIYFIWVEVVCFLNRFNITRIMIVGMLSVLAIGCSGDDDGDSSSEKDSVLIEKNAYYTYEFTVAANQQTNVKVAPASPVANGSAGPIDDIVSEAFIIDKSNYLSWVDQTQLNQFSDVIIEHTYSFLPLRERYETDWINLPKGTYYLLIENTNYGFMMPVGTSNVMFSIHHK
ncbi:hypothetical protein [Photobacterium sp.]|uniref:hypothetical protein n=1 Tax=Photobacterium sp. TaxID=660 RepID=UPI00299EF4D9|nr:hypothetical protein [Photobacterium sp.]MDX1303539.1 hypothetical protein [Photobacterium sp.]